jgi:hypothetical protein
LAVSLPGTGVIDGGYSESAEYEGVGLTVWIEELKRSIVVDSKCLSPTGERQPANPPNREIASTKVDREGHVLSDVSYVVVDDVERYT